MAQLVADCPRCGAQKMTFDIKAEHFMFEEYEWKRWYEAFCVCKACKSGTIFVLSLTNAGLSSMLANNKLAALDLTVNNFMEIESFINIKNLTTLAPPDHVPEDVAAAFNEGATSVAVECYNAAAAMFRLCVDLATRPLLPPADVAGGPNTRVRRDLGLRLPWLFENGKLPGDLRELSTCIREDGNDGVHAGTLVEEDAADLMDFAYELLERMYTEPKRLELAKERREKRRQPRTEVDESGAG